MAAERMHLYTCTDFSGVMTDCDEGCLEWVDKACRAGSSDLAGGQDIFQAAGGGRTDFFHLELTYDGDVLVKAVLDGGKLGAVINGQRRHEGMPPYRQMVYLLLWQTAPRVVEDADPYRAAKKSVCFSVHTLFLMSQYVVIVVPTK